MSAALANPVPVEIPVGAYKQFGPYGPVYEVLGWAQPENGQERVRIVIVQTGEETTYSYKAMMEDIEAL